MSILYPVKIDTVVSIPTVIDLFTPVQASSVNIVRDAILAIETELGVKPSGIYGTVRNRLDAFQDAIVALAGEPGSPPVGAAGGNLGGIYPDPVVIAIQNVNVGAVTPTDGYVLTYSAARSQWEPALVGSGSSTLSGDVTGISSNNTVVKINGASVPLSGSLTTGNVLVVSGPANLTYRQLTEDDIAPGFSITSFIGGSTVEVGATVTNPSFTASYSSTPASANITNTDGIDSPLILITPFTSGTVVGSFTHNTVTSVTFTLSATLSVTKTANQFISYLARTFSGVGTAGATSATASGNNAALVGATGTLTGTSPDGGLFSSIVGQTFGPFNPSSQKIYILTPHTASPHVYKDQNGFIFAMNSPTTFSFTNQNGASVSMDLYESTNSLSTTFSITVNS